MWLVDFLMPPLEGSPKQRIWEWKVSLMLGAGAVVLIYGAVKVAWAGDVDKKIADALKPVVEAQAAQGAKIDRVTEMLSAQLASATATQIRLTISKRCKTTGAAEREELNRELDRLQNEYVLYSKNGERYRQPACEEL